MRCNPNLRRRMLSLIAFCVVFSLFASCNMPGSTRGISVWIDVPVDGLMLPDIQPIKIEGHASATGEVSRVELRINDAPLTTIDAPAVEGSLASFQAEWTPILAGEYTIQAVAYDAAGTASAPDIAHVVFGKTPPTPTLPGCPTPAGGGPTPATCPTTVISLVPSLTATATLTPTSLPLEPVIQFWAEPTEIKAGTCVTFYWHVENVQAVVFGGISRPFDGSDSACPCTSSRYRLTATLLDGSEVLRDLNISVSGSCITPTSTPPPDTTPPPAPSLVVPANGLSIACKASQTLTWLPVSDPSGIAEYRVRVERHSGDNNWHAAPGGDLSGLQNKTTSIQVECGWYYRWRVRAIDGAGNAGNWSEWSMFSITLE